MQPSGHVSGGDLESCLGISETVRKTVILSFCNISARLSSAVIVFSVSSWDKHVMCPTVRVGGGGSNQSRLTMTDQGKIAINRISEQQVVLLHFHEVSRHLLIH